MISYSLYLNKLTPDPNDYAARVVNVRSYGLEDIVKMATAEGKTMTEEEMHSAYSSLEKAIVEIVSQGGNVQLSILNTNFSISGIFNSDEENFSSGKHTLNLNMHAGEKLVTAAQRNRLKRVKSTTYYPDPTKLEDVASGTVNEVVSPGNTACLKGESLKINPEQADEGLFFVNDRGQATKVDQIARNMPGELVFLIPPRLAKGAYHLEVRNRSYQELAVGRLKVALAVK